MLNFRQERHLADDKHANYLSWIYTRVTQIILCIIILVYVATIQRLNYREQETKTRNLQFIFLTLRHLVILKQDQGHQTYNDNVDPKKGYNHAKFDWSCFNGVREKRNVKGLFPFLLLLLLLLFQTRKYVDYLTWTYAKTTTTTTTKW